MAVSLQPKYGNQVELTWIDDAGTELVLVGLIDNLAIDNLKGTMNTVAWSQSRGQPTGKGYSTWEPGSGSFGFEVRELSDSSPGALPNWVQKTGAYSSAVSTAGTGTHNVWSWHMQVRIKAAVEHGDSDDHVFVVRNLHPTGFSYADGAPSTFTFSWEHESIDGDLTCLALGASAWGA